MKNKIFIVILLTVLIIACQSKLFVSNEQLPCCNGKNGAPCAPKAPVEEIPCCNGKNGPVCGEHKKPVEKAPCCNGKNGPVCSATTVKTKVKCSWKKYGKTQRCKQCCSYRKVCTEGKCETSKLNCYFKNCIYKKNKCNWSVQGNKKMKKCCSYYRKCVLSMKTNTKNCSNFNKKCSTVSIITIKEKSIKKCHSVVVFKDFSKVCTRLQCCMYIVGKKTPQSCKFESDQKCVTKKPPKRICSTVVINKRCSRKRCCSGQVCRWVGKAKCVSVPIKCTVQIGKRGYKQFIERICCRGSKCRTSIRWCYETAMVTVDTKMSQELCKGVASGDLQACLKIAKCSVPDKSTKCLTGK